MVLRPRAIVLTTAIAAFAVFCVVQDRGTTEGANRYAVLQRDALSGHGRSVTIDEVMRPAIDQSVRRGLLWGGTVMAAGLGVAAVVAGRGRSV